MITMDDKYRFEDFGFICEPGNDDPLTATISHKTLSIPGRIGLIDFGAEIGQKQFSFPIRIYERFHTRMQSQFNNLKNFFLDSYGQPREIKLVRDYEPDRYYSVKIAQQLLPDRLEDEGALTVLFIAFDPTAKFLIDADEIRMNSHIPILSHVRPARHSFSITSNQTIKLINDGSLALQPRITVSGTTTSLTVKNPKTNQSFKMTNIVSSKQIIVDGPTYMVTEGGIDSFSKLVGKFIDLLPGENNLEISGENMNLTISFKYKAKFM